MCSHNGEDSTFHGSLSIRGERDPCVEGVSLIPLQGWEEGSEYSSEYEPVGATGIQEEEHGGERD